MKLRNLKHEIRNKLETRKSKNETRYLNVLKFRFSDFVFVSGFGFLISDFQPEAT